MSLDNNYEQRTRILHLLGSCSAELSSSLLDLQRIQFLLTTRAIPSDIFNTIEEELDELWQSIRPDQGSEALDCQGIREKVERLIGDKAPF